MKEIGKEAMFLKLLGLSEEDMLGIQMLINLFIKHQKELMYIIENLDVFIELMHVLKEQVKK